MGRGDAKRGGSMQRGVVPSTCQLSVLETFGALHVKGVWVGIGGHHYQASKHLGFTAQFLGLHVEFAICGLDLVTTTSHPQYHSCTHESGTHLMLGQGPKTEGGGGD